MCYSWASFISLYYLTQKTKKKMKKEKEKRKKKKVLLRILLDLTM